jgi:hypothetical protein
MKNLVTGLILIVLVIVGCNYGGGGDGDSPDGDELIPGAGAEDYTTQDYESEFKIWEQDEAPYADADKTEQGDTNMCWGAVAANLITWAGWAADEDDTFDIFKEHFEDKAGYVYDAIRYYFDNYVSGASAEMVTVRESRSHKLLDFIVSAVHAGKGVAIKIARPEKKIGHFLSIYGYRYLAEEDNFILYFTDSDDGWHQMRQFVVAWSDPNDRWEIQNPYRDYYLAYAISLARN